MTYSGRGWEGNAINAAGTDRNLKWRLPYVFQTS